MKKTTQYMEGHKQVVEEELGDVADAIAVLIYVVAFTLLTVAPIVVFAVWKALV